MRDFLTSGNRDANIFLQAGLQRHFRIRCDGTRSARLHTQWRAIGGYLWARATYADSESEASTRMPTYEFRCEKCKKAFEQVWPLAEYDKRMKQRQKCPKCGSARVFRLLSMVQVKTAKKS